MTQQLVEPVSTTPPPGRWTTPIRVLAATTGTCLIAVGMVSAIGYFMVEYKTETTAFTEPIRQLRVVNTDGEIVIRAADTGSGASVISRSDNSFRKARHTEQVSGGVLTVDGSCAGGLTISDRCRVDFEITVPTGTVVNARTSTGDLSVLGTGSAVTASTATGDLTVSGPGSPVRLTTNVGDVIGEDLAGGDVTGRSNTGNVRFDFTRAPDRLTATTQVGDVRISVPDDATKYQVATDIDVGDRYINVPTDSGSGHVARLSTNTGDIRMGIGW
jgi:hypothetical protein